MRIRSLLALVTALALPAAALAAPIKPVASPKATTLKTTSGYKLQKLTVMAQAFDAAKALASKAAAAKAPKATKARFHEGVTLLFAAEKARRAGDLAAAKALAGHASAVLTTPGTTRLAVVKKNANLNARLGEASATLPTADGLVATEGTWLKQGWEPDFF